jgi:ring-1,2-phenylacetyl-CoA epoxidase subunit PaaD
MAARPSPEEIRNLLKEVKDPEIPVIDIAELGVLRDVGYDENGLVVSITPTYSGCPAMRAIEESIAETLDRHGVGPYRIRTVLSPAWTTDWLTDEAKNKLSAYGIAPPQGRAAGAAARMTAGIRKPVPCPFCRSADTKLTSEFGSTACKALHFCNACRQPFEEFKCH